MESKTQEWLEEELNEIKQQNEDILENQELIMEKLEITPKDNDDEDDNQGEDEDDNEPAIP